MDKLMWILLAVAAGTGLPIQAGLNCKLAKTGGSPIHAAMISCSVGVIKKCFEFRHDLYMQTLGAILHIPKALASKANVIRKLMKKLYFNN